MYVEAWAGLPTDMDCCGSCPDYASISVTMARQKSIYEIFFPPHKYKNDVTVENGQV